MTRETAVLGEAFDLLSLYEPGGFFFERGGAGLAAPAGGVVRGFADSAEATAAATEWCRTSGEVTPAGVLVAAFPFDPGAPASLRLPSAAARRDEGGAARLTAPSGASGRPLSRVVPAGVPREAFGGTQIDADPAAYVRAVEAALRRIRAGELDKVVLARTVTVRADRPFDPRALAARLRAADPHAYVFAAPTTVGGVIVGASPELLIAKRGDAIRSNPLAGSAPRSGDPDEDRANAEALLASAKDQEEHAIVVEAVAEVLGPVCEDLSWDPAPVLRETPNVWHLSTTFRGRLRDGGPNVFALAAALHPTPAVGGRPRAAALTAIAELELFDRGSYAGPVGWMDTHGDGEVAIALRCAELRGASATVYAGAGIVAGSGPSAELAETDRKLRAFLDALRWG